MLDPNYKQNQHQPQPPKAANPYPSFLKSLSKSVRKGWWEEDDADDEMPDYEDDDELLFGAGPKVDESEEVPRMPDFAAELVKLDEKAVRFSYYSTNVNIHLVLPAAN